LFAAARKQAGLGHTRVARALYRELLARYPGPGTAAVQVVLGNLEMELGAPDRALAAFEGYLRVGGAIEPEALQGKVRALRALGRTAEESATIRTYLARYPSGFHAPTLKKRLQDLE
jgi:tetratricopeptide (TPR) repeat protein